MWQKRECVEAAPEESFASLPFYRYDDPEDGPGPQRTHVVKFRVMVVIHANCRLLTPDTRFMSLCRHVMDLFLQ